MKKSIVQNLIEVTSAATEIHYLVLGLLQISRSIKLQISLGGYYLIPSPSPRVETVDCGDEAASWFSEFLGQPCRLIRQNPNFSRDTKKRSLGGTIKSLFHLLYLYIVCPEHVFCKQDKVTFSI